MINQRADRNVNWKQGIKQSHFPPCGREEAFTLNQLRSCSCETDFPNHDGNILHLSQFEGGCAIG